MTAHDAICGRNLLVLFMLFVANLLDGYSSLPKYLLVLKKLMGFLFWRSTKMRYEILLYYLVCVGTSCSQCCNQNGFGLVLCVRWVFSSLYYQCTGRKVRTYYTLLAETNRGFEGLRAISSTPCCFRNIACSKSTVSDTAGKCYLGQSWILRQSSVVPWKPRKELVLHHWFWQAFLILQERCFTW